MVTLRLIEPLAAVAKDDAISLDADMSDLKGGDAERLVFLGVLLSSDPKASDVQKAHAHRQHSLLP